MKIKKILFSASLLTPAVIVPTMSTSCSVYQDLMKDYVPSYEQLTGTLTFAEAANKWFEKNNKQNIGKDEFFWNCAQAAKYKESGVLHEFGTHKLTYEGQFTTMSSYVKYFNIVDATKHKISFRINSKVETKDNYFIDGIPQGYGITHYTCDLELQNLVFDVSKFHIDEPARDYWLVKPAKFNGLDDWNDYLTDDEKVIFNIRTVTEVYDQEGIQYYGFEATEAAIMDKELSYKSVLGDLLDYFCCFFSYYLDKCTFA